MSSWRDVDVGDDDDDGLLPLLIPVLEELALQDAVRDDHDDDDDDEYGDVDYNYDDDDDGLIDSWLDFDYEWPQIT